MPARGGWQARSDGNARHPLGNGAGTIRRLILTVFAATALALASLPVRAASECAPGHVGLRGDWGQARFAVRIADDDGERARGLMHVDRMPRGEGMLFVYPRPQRVRFWMKNTLIPLDMIFVDVRGIVTRVHHRAVPGDLTPIEGGEGVLAVLEINGGLAERFGIGPGTELRHPVFGEEAAWPCAR